MKVLITASRDWADEDLVWMTLDDYLADALRANSALHVIHGDCPTGGDRHARRWVQARRRLHDWLTEGRHPARWARDGKRAGFIRNQLMVDLMPDVCLAFVNQCRRCPRRDVHGSHGAMDTVRRCDSSGIPVRRFGLEER